MEVSRLGSGGHPIQCLAKSPVAPHTTVGEPGISASITYAEKSLGSNRTYKATRLFVE